MTSREKILKIKRATKRLDCSVLIRTGRASPGLMLAEGEADNVGLWTEAVRKLRYKMYQQMKKEEVDQKRLEVPAGEVLETESIREFARVAKKDEELGRWWEEAMGFANGEPKPVGLK
ncbi:hypothetical protein CJF30_00001880 [Rutstroemia sp. NJR-2017a BBW]|nr:hypothetical protein CJF30_00001880 [Rutstroemia sp. NJR-2017a BBW]